MSRRMVFCGLATMFALVVAVHGGVYYEAKTTGEGKGAETQDAYVKVWVSGEKVKIIFESSGNPIIEKGNYLLSTDGGKVMYLVNPKEKSYSRWDMDAMMGLVGGIGKIMNLEIADAKVEKLEEKPGGQVAGLSTTYYRYRQTYRQKVKFMMIKQENECEQIHEMWNAPELVEKALSVYLRKEPSVPSEEIKKFWAMESEKVRGFPLKSRTVTTIKDKKGATQTTVVTTEVLKLQIVPVPDATFALPSEYKEVELFPSNQGEENPLSKLFGGKH